MVRITAIILKLKLWKNDLSKTSETYFFSKTEYILVEILLLFNLNIELGRKFSSFNFGALVERIDIKNVKN